MSVITCRDIGSIGRAGNQLFLYCLSKGYAESVGAHFQCGEWWGRKVFPEAFCDPVVGPYLPQTELDSESSKPLGYWFGQTNIDIRVFGQHQDYLQFYTRTKAKAWLRFYDDFEALRPMFGATYSAAHLRRGDYVGNDKYCHVSDLSYELALKKFQIPDPIFCVEEGLMVPHKTFQDMGLPWLSDFLFLRGATHLLRGNSSFSVWASWLGSGRTYSPVVGSMTGHRDVEFVEGNHPCTAGMFANQSDLKLAE